MAIKKPSRLGAAPEPEQTFENLQKPSNETKVQLNVRCTPDERREIKHYANQLDMGINEFLLMTFELWRTQEGQRYPSP